MARQAIIEFVDDLCGYFGPPKPANGQSDDAYLKTWMRYAMDDFGGFSPEELARAFKVLRSTSKYKSMPSNAEILDACREARKQIRTERPQLATQPKPERATHTAREKLALDLIKSEMGRTAAKEGWIGELFAFVRDNGHMPRTQSEIKLLIDNQSREKGEVYGAFSHGGAKGTDQRYEACIRGEAGAFNDALERLGASMLARRKALEDYVLEGKPYTWGTN